jgi:predicted enzyme related to lactoylglutathione lyase
VCLRSDTRCEGERNACQSRPHHRLHRVHYQQLEATKAFYVQVFGWTFEDYGPAYASFSEGKMAGGFAAVGPPSSAGPLAVIFADDLAATEQRVKLAGGTITKETFSLRGGNELAVWHEG